MALLVSQQNGLPRGALGLRLCGQATVYGTNSDGVLLVSSGVDLISGRPVRGRADVQELYRARDWSKLAQIGPLYI